ncbi:MAG: SGNH/GDSL hydrolase family protein [Campylobacteraceae bacterium]|nr:SGNH/GDSL hydrolase family protein [Campylobacteraceae bacterium]
MNILALGDCNTLGDTHYEQNSFPERFADKIKADVKNCGYTMTTTREMQYFAKKYLINANLVLVQYGLVDSWKTFKYSPYVLYYPDNSLRKIARKIVKKYKKIARKIGLNRLLGVENVVLIDEYRGNIARLVSQNTDKIFILIETVPNKDLSRNEEIKRYNIALQEISNQYKNCYCLNVFDIFIENLENYYIDETHINDVGYDVITKKLLELYDKIEINL